MSRKFSISVILLFTFLVVANGQRTINGESIAIVNGAASSMPRPVYPQQFKDFCVGGKVEVLIEVMTSCGKPLTAKAISGDALLGDFAEKAALEAVFYPRRELIKDYKFKGILVYNFIGEKKCTNVGIVNKKALSLPKPLIDPGIKIRQETAVQVGVVIDETGKVVSAQILTNLDPALRPFFLKAARQARFYPTKDVGRIRIKAFIVYKLKLDGKVKT